LRSNHEINGKDSNEVGIKNNGYSNK